MKLPFEVEIRIPDGAFYPDVFEDLVRDCAKVLFDAAERCGGQTFLATLLREEGLAILTRYELEPK